MIRLNVEDYDKAMEPLQQVPINTLFAQAVLSGQVEGTVYVDCVEAPSAFYIVHPYGMSLLFGKTNDPVFHRNLRQYLVNSGQLREQSEWLQVFPDNWNAIIRQIIESQPTEAAADRHELDSSNSSPIVEYTRINFTFDRHKYEAAASKSSASPYRIVPVNEEIFLKLNQGVNPQHFWIDADQFLAEGIGFSLLENGEAASTAFSAYRIGEYLEIGIETAEHARGKGYAFQVGLALIEYCIRNGLEPVWSCRRENEASYLLAQKLGFVPSIRLPYYQLV